MSSETIQPGDRVHDRDDPDPTDAIVVTPQSQTAAEWRLAHTDGTLADDNPDYPADANAITVVFVDDLIEYGPPYDPAERTKLSMQTLNDSPVRYYTFPAPRLQVIESPATGIENTEQPTERDESETTTTSPPPDDDSDTDPDHATEPTVNESDNEDDSEADTSPSPELQQLKATLEDEGLAATVEEDDTLAVKRLGQTYRIHPGEDIEGDGALRSKLETLVADAR
jgi:hypothetical protein